MLKKIRYFLSENRLILRLGYIYAAIFIAAVLIGSLLPYDQIPYLKKDEEMFFLSIFLNNLQVGMAILGIGAFTGGIMAAGILFYNGYIIGKLVQYLIVNQEVQQIFTGLLPHAFVEILGFILFSIVSFFPFIYLYRFIKGETIDLKKLTVTVLQLIFAAIVLLFAASLLEEYVSHVHLP
ncbi:MULTISPECIES: stage II sporulation protein M [unclassified Bacillus (in: firmicutes)]|uniref:stage II sporulation protein M n=1 Tax=unclassified Bacillus (in: firmicutes) TaxID=185979 RepID=UPI001CB969FC|nr:MULTISPECIES: stage II sporulation protein M [unclassified Bacillus (in: firmicutes)]